MELRGNFHAQSVQTVLEEFTSSAKRGLSSEEIKKRLERYGPNVLPKKKPPSAFFIFVRQFRSPLIFILAIAGVVTLVLGEYTDGIVIWIAVLLNTFIGYFQEHKATHALSALQQVLKGEAHVIRDDNEHQIAQEEVVPGDIIVLLSGDKVPADARMIESWGLEVSEAALTGEWIPSRKTSDTLDMKTPLADRENMVYMGTIISGGEGRAVVVGTGVKTEIGTVATLVQSVEKERTPYQVKLTKFSWLITAVISAAAVFIFIEGIVTGGRFVEMFTIAVAVAVAAIPEGLPIAMTAILAIGMQRILGQNGLVRRLTSAETLGSASIIATDKTLTLTEGRMEVQEVVTLREDARHLALTIAALANEAFIENPDAVFSEWVYRGGPTDKALLKAASEAGISRRKLEREEPLITKFPFDPTTKYIASFHKDAQGVIAYISGAPESLLALAAHPSVHMRRKFEQELERLTEMGLRVIAVGYKHMPKHAARNPQKFKEMLTSITVVGLIAMRDPLRRGVKRTIARARRAGIKTIMVTGDHVRTARAVARAVGIYHDDGEIIEGMVLDEWSDEELEKRLPNISVYARVEPKHKMRIIDAWQKRGEVIAMTGDGINDAPALHKADIGIALGSGTDVAKEVSDLILLGDKFSIIPAAIREGRIIVDNIRKVITYMMSSAFTEVVLIGTSIVLGLPLPVTAAQILWINIVEDGLPGIALTFEKGEQDIMRRKPEKKNMPLLTNEMRSIIFIVGFITDLILLGLFLWLVNTTTYTIEHIRTFVFVALGIDSLLFVFSCRNLHRNIWKYNPFSNRYLIGAVMIGFILMGVVVYLPILQILFHTVALNVIDWMLLIGLGLVNILLIEIVKWYFINRRDVSKIGGRG